MPAKIIPTIDAIFNALIATSFLKKGVSSPPMAGGLRPISSFSPIKDRLKTAAGVALGAAGVTAAAAGISKLKAKAEQEKKQEKIKNDKNKLVSTDVVDNIKKDNEKKNNEIKKDNEKKDTTPKNPSGKVIPKPTKPLSDKSPAAKAGIPIEKRQKAANMNAAFQATKDKNSGYTKMDFIKDFPNSQTAKKFNKGERIPGFKYPKKTKKVKAEPPVNLKDMSAVSKPKEVTIDDFKSILQSRDRSKAGYSVPAHGLYLEKVYYPRHIFAV